MKHQYPLLLLLFFVFSIVSCSPRVTTSRPTQKDLSMYNTFAYLPNADVEMENAQDKDDVNRRIIETVNNQMQQLGYTLDRDEPDLLVLISVKKDRETEVETDPVYATYPYGASGIGRVSPYYNNFYYNSYSTYGGVVGYDTDTYDYTEGTLIVSLVDRETRNTVWKGITSENIYAGSTTDELIGLVDNIFEEYPLKGKAR